MKVSLNTIKKYLDFELPPVDELVAKINAQLGKVEEVIELGERYKDAVVVRIVDWRKHPDADRLSICKIDDNGAVDDIDRDENGHVQVVCGAPNAHSGMWAVWLPPRSTVPSSYDSEPFVLDARELRGVMSQGMLAAPDELAIGSGHDGIVELSERDLTEGKELATGASFAELFGLDDTIIDIENKMFTHRPDLFGQLGVAREISGIIKGVPSGDEDVADTRYENPDWYWMLPSFTDASELELEVFNDTPDKVPRFMAVAMSNVEVAPSPMWLQCELVRLGSKPINNIVDITNYVMLLSAQPSHAYDYDKLRGHKLGARLATAGEKVTLLNDKTYDLDETDIVIVDGEGPVGLGGVMGGGDSEVSATTRNIVIECATFDMYTVRKTSMRHGLFTEALTRFNKGQSKLQNDRILDHIIMLISQYSGAVEASSVFDLPDKTGQLDEVSLSGEIRIGIDFINSRLGTSLTSEQIGGLLRRTNFASYPPEDAADALLVTAPFWRTDIELPEDIVEEVGRLYGYDRLPRELPERSIKPAAKNPVLETKQAIRQSLKRAGAHEVLTYSFVHENVISRAEQDAAQAFKLSNALSPDLQYYRLSVLPSLLDKVHMNVKSGHDEFVLYEIGKGHNKKYHADDDDGLPSEMSFVDAVYASKQPHDGAPYYYMRRLVQQLALDLGFTLRFKPVEEAMDFPVTAPFDLERSSLVETIDGTFIGMIGELKQSVKRNFKLPAYASAMTLDLKGLHTASSAPRIGYAALSKFPSITQDISLRVPTDTSYSEVFWVVYKHMDSQIENTDVIVSPVTIYQPADDTSTKTITLRIRATSHVGTLKDDDMKPALDAAAGAVKSQFDGERI